MIDPVEYERRYYGRIYGKRRARVVENQDPERRGRVRVENTELYGVSASPWCMPSFPFYGGIDSGFFSVPPIGSLVWIECEEGLPEYPVYTGGFFDLTNKGHKSDGSYIETSNEFQNEPSAAPAHARGDLDGSDYGSLKGNFGVPPSSFEGEYGKITLLQTESGHKIELDDTDGGERVQIHHAKGAHIEIMPDGTINIVTEGKILTRAGHRQEVVENNRSVLIGAEDKSRIEGDSRQEILGSCISTIQGESEFDSGSTSATINGSLSLEASTIDIESLNNFQLGLGGDLGVISFGDLDLSIAGASFMSFSNANATPELTMVTPSGSISANNGTLFLSSSDLLNTSTYGVEMRAGLGGQVYLGNLSSTSRTTSLSVGSVPLLKERAVLGEQLSLLLNAVLTSLNTFFTTMQTGGSTPGFGGPNPILGVASATALASLEVAKNTFMTTDLILSDAVYLSKE